MRATCRQIRCDRGGERERKRTQIGALNFPLASRVPTRTAKKTPTLHPGYKVIGYMVFPAIWSIFGWSRTEWDFIQ